MVSRVPCYFLTALHIFRLGFILSDAIASNLEYMMSGVCRESMCDGLFAACVIRLCAPCESGYGVCAQRQI